MDIHKAMDVLVDIHTYPNKYLLDIHVDILVDILMNILMDIRGNPYRYPWMSIKISVESHVTTRARTVRPGQGRTSTSTLHS